MQQLYIENTVFEYTQLVAKKGCFYKVTFDEMYGKLKSGGFFDVYLTATKQGAAGETIESGYKIIDKNLRGEGYDKFEITVLYRKQHPLTALLKQNFFFGGNGNQGEITLGASSCGFIQ